MIKKISLTDQVHHQIRSKIIDLTYPLGSRLNPLELQEEYGVSSTPIREALTRLQVEGLVVSESNIGFHVISLSAIDVQEIQDLALTLHSAAICFAMERSEHDKIVTEMSRFLKDYKNAKTIENRVKGIFNFIGVFYKYCGNTRLDNNMKVIQGQQLILRYLYCNHLGLEESYTTDYESILESVRQGNTEQIIQQLRENYLKATPILIEAISKLG